MINIKSILYEICDDERVFDKDIDLIDSGLLDSYAFIELISSHLSIYHFIGFLMLLLVVLSRQNPHK